MHWQTWLFLWGKWLKQTPLRARSNWSNFLSNAFILSSSHFSSCSNEHSFGSPPEFRSDRLLKCWPFGAKVAYVSTSGKMLKVPHTGRSSNPASVPKISFQRGLAPRLSWKRQVRKAYAWARARSLCVLLCASESCLSSGQALDVREAAKSDASHSTRRWNVAQQTVFVSCYGWIPTSEEWRDTWGTRMGDWKSRAGTL